MRDIWAHLHIPKCGGTTFRTILQQNHPDGFGDTNSLYNSYQYTAAQVLEILRQYPCLRCLTGHKLSLDLPFDEPDLTITASTFVRDPIDRFLSHYFFHRNHTGFVAEAYRMDLDEYIGWALEEGHQRMYIDGQTRFLSGDSSQKGLERIEEAIRSRRLVALPLARFDEAVFLLNRKYPAHFGDIRYNRRNASRKDQEVDERQRGRIAAHCRYDLRLLETADACLDELAAEGFAGPRAYESELAAHLSRDASSPSEGGGGPTGAGLRGKTAQALRKLACWIEK